MDIDNFKCFEKKSFSFKRFNILAGGNGCGKSSMLQPLLLMRQAFYNSFPKLSQSIPMNGELVSLKSFDNVAKDPKLEHMTFSFKFRPVPFEKRYTVLPLLEIHNSDSMKGKELALGLEWYSQATEDNVKINLKNENGEVVAYLDDNDDYADAGHNLFTMGFPLSSSLHEERHSIFGYGAQFIYLSADRLGPRSIVPVTSTREKINPLRRDGSGALQEIFAYNPGLGFKDEYSATHLDSLNEIFNKVFPGINLTIRVQEGIDGRSCIVPFFEEEFSKRTICPYMTGFGLFYSLPVIAAPVLAYGDATVIIENPEAHLHPAAQSALGFALATSFDDDTQVFIETHSEHFINGVRKAIVSGNCANEDVALHFFSKDSQAADSGYKRVEISKKGELSEWPRGFFDQVEIDLDLILRGSMQ